MGTYFAPRKGRKFAPAQSISAVASKPGRVLRLAGRLWHEERGGTALKTTADLKTRPPGWEEKVVRVSAVKVLEGEAPGTVEAFVSGIGNVDEVKDLIESGAYVDSLKARNPKGVWSHDWDKPIAKTLDAHEVKSGDAALPQKIRSAGAGALYIKCLFNLKTQRGSEAYEDVKFFGDEQEWSIGYIVADAEMDEKTGIRHIKKMDLYEYSPVLFGANDLTQTVGVKQGVGLPPIHVPMIARKQYMEDIEPVEDSYEDTQEDLAEGLRNVEGGGYSITVIATFDDHVIYSLRPIGPQGFIDWDTEPETYSRTYVEDEATDTMTFGDRTPVEVQLSVVADADAGKRRVVADMSHKAVSDAAWDGAASRFTDDEWKAACAACEGDNPDHPKSDCYLPHHEPGGALSRSGLGKAAGRYPQTVEAERKNTDKAKTHLVAHYKEIGEDVPESLGGTKAAPAIGRRKTAKDDPHTFTANDDDEGSCSTCGRTPGNWRHDVPKSKAADDETGGSGDTSFSKDEVDYRDAEGGKQQCGNCQHFLEDENACELVAGEIEASFVCDKWAAEGKSNIDAALVAIDLATGLLIDTKDGRVLSSSHYEKLQAARDNIDTVMAAHSDAMAARDGSNGGTSSATVLPLPQVGKTLTFAELDEYRKMTLGVFE